MDSRSQKKDNVRETSDANTTPPSGKFDPSAAKDFLKTRYDAAVSSASTSTSTVVLPKPTPGLNSITLHSTDNSAFRNFLQSLASTRADLPSLVSASSDPVSVNSKDGSSVGVIPVAQALFSRAAGQGSASAVRVESPSSVVSSGSQGGLSVRSHASGSDVSVAEAEALSSTSTNPARDLISILQQNTRQADDAKRAQAEQLARQIAADRLAAEEAARKAEDALRQMQETLRQSAATRGVEAAALQKQKEDSTEQQRKAEQERLVAEAVRKAEMEADARHAAMQEQLAFLQRQLAAQQAEQERLVAEAVKQAEIKKSDAERQEQAKQRIKQLIAIRRLIQEEKRKKRELEEQELKALEARKATEEAATKAFLELEAQKAAAQLLIETQKRDAEIDIRISQVKSSLENLYGKKVELTNQLQAVQEQVAQLNTNLEELNKTIKAANKKTKSTLAENKTELLTSIEKSNKRLVTINGIIQGINAEILAHQQQIEELQSAKSNTTPKPSSIDVANGIVVQKEMAALRHGLDKGKSGVARAKIAPAPVAKVVEVSAAPAPVLAPANSTADVKKSGKKKQGSSNVQPNVATAAPSPAADPTPIVLDPPATAEKSLSELQEDLRLLEERIGNCKKYLSSQRQEDITRREEFTQALSELEEAKVALLKRMQEFQPTPDAVSTPSNVVVSGQDSPASAPVKATQTPDKKKKKKNNGSAAAVVEQTSQYLTKKAVTSLLDDLCGAVKKKRDLAIDNLNSMIVFGEIDACKLIREVLGKIKVASSPNEELKEWKYFQAIINNFSLEESFLDQLFVNAAIFPGLYKKVLEQFQVTESVTEAIQENNLPKIKALVQYYPEWVARHAVCSEDSDVVMSLVEYAIDLDRPIEVVKSLLIPGVTHLDCCIKAFEYINDDNYMVESIRSFSLDYKKTLMRECIAQLKSNVLTIWLRDNPTEVEQVLRDAIYNCEWALLTNLFEHVANQPLADVVAAKQMIDRIFAYGFTGVSNRDGVSRHVLTDILQIKGVNQELLEHVIQKLPRESLNAQYSMNEPNGIFTILTFCILRGEDTWPSIPLLKRYGCKFSSGEIAAAISTRNFKYFAWIINGIDCDIIFNEADQNLAREHEERKLSKEYSPTLSSARSLLDSAINSILMFRNVDFDISIIGFILSHTENRTTYHSQISLDQMYEIINSYSKNRERDSVVIDRLQREVTISETDQYPLWATKEARQGGAPQPLQGRAAVQKMTELVGGSMGGGRGR